MGTDQVQATCISKVVQNSCKEAYLDAEGNLAPKINLVARMGVNLYCRQMAMHYSNPKPIRTKRIGGWESLPKAVFVIVSINKVNNFKGFD